MDRLFFIDNDLSLGKTLMPKSCVCLLMCKQGDIPLDGRLLIDSTQVQTFPLTIYIIPRKWKEQSCMITICRKKEPIPCLRRTKLDWMHEQYSNLQACMPVS